jgi:hypothetical protein
MYHFNTPKAEMDGTQKKQAAPSLFGARKRRNSTVRLGPDPRRVQDKGPPNAQSAHWRPLSPISGSSYFGSGSAPKLAWTNIHFSPFFT